MSTVCYLDTSALVKLVVREEESADLTRWLARRDSGTVTSALTGVELMRAARRHGHEAAEAAVRIIERIDLIAMTAEILSDAGRLDRPALRTLDAIHLATARALGADLEYVVAYDHRLLEAAGERGLPVITPGGGPA